MRPVGVSISGGVLVRIRRARFTDAGELFTLQRGVRREAQEYDDPRIPPLCETLADVEALLRDGATTVLVAAATVDGEHGRRGRLLGSARLRVAAPIGRVGR